MPVRAGAGGVQKDRVPVRAQAARGVPLFPSRAPIPSGREPERPGAGAGRVQKDRVPVRAQTARGVPLLPPILKENVANMAPSWLPKAMKNR